MLTLMLIGALLWYVPQVTSKSQPIAGVPASPPLASVARYTVPAHGRACMPNVAVTSRSDEVWFSVYPKSAKGGGSPVDFLLTAPRYRARAHLGGGYPGGGASLRITPPATSVLATACFINRGDRPIVLVGSEEARAVSRSVPLTINGKQTPGDISLTFYEGRSIDGLGLFSTIVSRASRLTDGLLPPALIWVVAVATALGVPLTLVLAFHDALREDERPPGSETGD